MYELGKTDEVAGIKLHEILDPQGESMCLIVGTTQAQELINLLNRLNVTFKELCQAKSLAKPTSEA